MIYCFHKLDFSCIIHQHLSDSRGNISHFFITPVLSPHCCSLCSLHASSSGEMSHRAAACPDMLERNYVVICRLAIRSAELYSVLGKIELFQWSHATSMTAWVMMSVGCSLPELSVNKCLIWLFLLQCKVTKKPKTKQQQVRTYENLELSAF